MITARTMGGETFQIPEADDYMVMGTACTYNYRPPIRMMVTRREWQCSYCGCENEDDKLQCPHCGASRGKAVRQ